VAQFLIDNSVKVEMFERKLGAMVTLVLMIHKGSGLTGNGLMQKIRQRFPFIELEVYDNSDLFLKRMCKPIRCHTQEICVVLAESRERLEELMVLETIIERRRLLLILPENKKEIFSMGLRLLPRYMGCLMDNPEELLSVMEKMIDNLMN
jgi:hypothetical protein